MRYLEGVDATFPSARPTRSLHRFANPGRFLRLSGRAQPWLDSAALVLLAVGLTWGLLLAPADWQQGAVEFAAVAEAAPADGAPAGGGRAGL